MHSNDQRGAVRQLCEWKTFFGEREMGFHGLTHDVSETGALIRAQAIPKIDSLVRVRFEAPSAAKPVILGHVIRHASVQRDGRAERAFGIKLVGDRMLMRELLQSINEPRLNLPVAPKVAPPPPAETVPSLEFASRAEFQRLHDEELSKGGLGFAPSKVVPLNHSMSVEVRFRWNTQVVPVSGRIVRCDELGGRFRAILLMDDPHGTLAALQTAAHAGW